jgi:hypothetical protein
VPYLAESSKKNSFTAHVLLRKQCLKLVEKKKLRGMEEENKCNFSETIFSFVAYLHWNVKAKLNSKT